MIASRTVEESEVSKGDIPRKDKVRYQIERTKGKVAIIIKSGNLSKRKEWIDFRLAGQWRRYFPNHFIKRTVTVTNRRGKTKATVSYIVRFNLYYSEALRANEDLPQYDQALENQLLNEWHSQYKKAIGAVIGLLGALTRDRSIQMLIVLATVFGIPIGMALWPNVIATPNTVVHWVTRP